MHADLKKLFLIRPRILAGALGIGRSTLWRWVRQGILPRPIRIRGISGWPPEDVEALIEAARRKRESDSSNEHK